jgi:hypothetical protein
MRRTEVRNLMDIKGSARRCKSLGMKDYKQVNGNERR